MKDYLEESGLTITPLTPRQVIKEAFSAKIIADGAVWIKMLDTRNMLSHTYDSAVFTQAVKAIDKDYLPALKQLHEFLKKDTWK